MSTRIINYRIMSYMTIALVLAICIFAVPVSATTINTANIIDESLYETVLESNPNVTKLSDNIPIGDNVIQPGDFSYTMNADLFRSNSTSFEKELLSSPTLYTTDNSPFKAYCYSDWTEEEGKAFHENVILPIYDRLTGTNVQDYPTFKYNCHSYAWYNDSTNNEYVIKYMIDVNAFLGDDHTMQITDANNLSAGDIVTYWEIVDVDSEGNVELGLCLHSALVDHIESNGNIVCKSKWGDWGLYIHNLNYVPTNYGTIFEDENGIPYCYLYTKYYRYTQGEHFWGWNKVSDTQHEWKCYKCTATTNARAPHDYQKTSRYNNSGHQMLCYDCGSSIYQEHNIYYTGMYNGNGHQINCSDCSYSIYEDHDLYISEIYNDVYTIECRECSYSISCNCDREYVDDGASGHYVDCLDGCFSEFEPHTYEMTGEYDNYGHEFECIYCGYSDYIDHDLYMYFEDVGEYVVKCHDCTYSIECWESPEYYGNSENGHWVDCPCGCYSFFEAHTPGSYSSTEEGYHEIECADCGYVYTEGCNYGSAETGNSSYHFFECTDCGYERAEAHVFMYTMIANDIFKHNAYCRVCQTPYEKPHNWVSVSGGYRCSNCRMPTSILPDYSSLSNEELSLLLSSMSEEEIEQFIALLPEDAVARVTAILPRDDEHLTE